MDGHNLPIMEISRCPGSYMHVGLLGEPNIVSYINSPNTRMKPPLMTRISALRMSSLVLFTAQVSIQECAQAPEEDMPPFSGYDPSKLVQSTF